MYTGSQLRLPFSPFPNSGTWHWVTASVIPTGVEADSNLGELLMSKLGPLEMFSQYTPFAQATCLRKILGDDSDLPQIILDYLKQVRLASTTCVE